MEVHSSMAGIVDTGQSIFLQLYQMFILCTFAQEGVLRKRLKKAKSNQPNKLEIKNQGFFSHLLPR